MAATDNEWRARPLLTTSCWCLLLLLVLLVLARVLAVSACCAVSEC